MTALPLTRCDPARDLHRYYRLDVSFGLADWRSCLKAGAGWEHIALTGDYVWTNSNAMADFRPLRDVPSAFMAQAA